ncbi:MAG TPA: hypothetical protein VNM48_20390, partial [Chloroflexota bacterium]|nr:hypothetical protein [Chloroflexota bacterium]
MPVISGGIIAPGVLLRNPALEQGGTAVGSVGATAIGYGPYLIAGIPGVGALNNVAQKGALVIDTTNGALYQ